MPGQRQRRPDRLQGHREVSPVRVVAPPLVGELVGGDRAPAPPVPLAMDGSALRPEVAELWASYWSSAAAGAVDRASDSERLRWWAQCVNERIIVAEVVAAARLTRVAGGGVGLNPLIRYLSRLTAWIGEVEQHYGMTPLARFRLGLEAAEFAETVDDLNRRLNEAARARG